MRKSFKKFVASFLTLGLSVGLLNASVSFANTESTDPTATPVAEGTPIDKTNFPDLDVYASASYADEISIILADEEKDVDVIKGHLEERIERRARDFEGYEPDEADKVYNAVIDTNGLYVIMVIADDAENIVDDINDVIEEVK